LLYGYEIMIMYLTIWWICVGSSLPVCLYGCIVCGCSSCDDHQFDWWEQMGEVLVVNKGMASPLLSHLGWSCFTHDFFRATTPVSFYASLLCTLCENCIWFMLASWCAQVVGVVLRTPRLRYYTFITWRFL